MDAVEIRKMQDGGYWVSARAESLAEAQAATNALLELPPSEAFRWPSGPTPPTFTAEGDLLIPPPLTPAQAALAERANDDAPLDALNFDKPRDTAGEG